MTAIIAAIGIWLLVGLPFIVTAAALLDAAHRPEWAWVMAGRRRPVWMGIIVAGGVTYLAAPVITIIYWLTARRDVRAIERGDLDGFSSDPSPNS